MPSLLNRELKRNNVRIDEVERKFVSRAYEIGIFNDTANFETGHIMEHFRALDTEVNMTVERETAGSDPGNLYPVTNEGLANEKGWLRTYALIENVLLAMVRFYDVEVDPETKPNGHHSFHMNLLNTFDRDTHSLYKALGKAKQSINELRKWRNWQKLSDQRKEPHKWSYGGGKMYYCVWYSEVYEGLVDAFVIYIKDSILRDVFNYC